MKSSDDAVRFVAKIILSMDEENLELLKHYLDEGEGGSAGVAAVIPPNLPLKEDGIEIPFDKWPEEYWESQA